MQNESHPQTCILDLLYANRANKIRNEGTQPIEPTGHSDPSRTRKTSRKEIEVIGLRFAL
jgi:hypothetical protein